MNTIPEEPHTRPDGRSVWSRNFTPDKRLLDGKSTEPLGSGGDPILLSLDERSGINRDVCCVSVTVEHHIRYTHCAYIVSWETSAVNINMQSF